jgi:hypothetical protein
VQAKDKQADAVAILVAPASAAKKHWMMNFREPASTLTQAGHIEAGRIPVRAASQGGAVRHAHLETAAMR